MGSHSPMSRKKRHNEMKLYSLLVPMFYAFVIVGTTPSAWAINLLRPSQSRTAAACIQTFQAVPEVAPYFYGEKYDNPSPQYISNRVVESSLRSKGMTRDWLYIGYTVKSFSLETIIQALGDSPYRRVYRRRVNGGQARDLLKLYKFIFSEDGKVFPEDRLEVISQNERNNVETLFIESQILKVKDWILQQYPEMATLDFKSVSTDNIRNFLRNLERQYGPSLILARWDHEYFDYPNAK